MTTHHIKSLLNKYAEGNISKEELELLVNYFKLTGNDHEIFAAMDDIWQKLDENEVYISDETKKQIYNRISNQTIYKKESAIRQILPWLKYAAAAMIVIAGASTFFFIKTQSENTIANRYKNDVKPGFDQATLTLSNGKIITLNNSASQQIAKEQGVSIEKTANGIVKYNFQAIENNTQAENTLSTPKGGQFQVVLADGSHVWLNTASTLTFPVNFTSNERTVKLSGEAYFEVAKDAKRPFKVITDNQQVKVLGTHFDVNAYADEPITRTTLIEGKVNVQANNQNILLQPGKQTILTKNKLQVLDADMEEVLAWKDGLFLYNKQSLATIMRQIARWYNVEVVFEDNEAKEQIFSGSLSRYKNISEMLEVLETTGSVHFKIEGRRVTVMP